MGRLKNFIGGELVEAKGSATQELINPSTGEAYLEVPVSSQDDVDAACAAAAGAFESWKRTTPSERSLALFRIADALEAAGEELVALEAENTGKPVQLTMDEEIPPMVDQIRFFAGAARHLQGLSTGEYMEGHTSSIRREPIGVCAAVTPWNYPMMMAVWKWAPAIAAGNAMVLKPSDTTPVSTVRMAEIMAEHLPAGVFTVVVAVAVLLLLWLPPPLPPSPPWPRPPRARPSAGSMWPTPTSAPSTTSTSSPASRASSSGPRATPAWSRAAPRSAIGAPSSLRPWWPTSSRMTR